MSPIIDNIVLANPGPFRGTGYVDENRPLATFYADLLDMRITREDWFVIANERQDDRVRVAIGDGPSEHPPPRWPDPEYPQQLHPDIPVYDLDAADALALRLGATKLLDAGDHRVYADPVGHPFCLCVEDIEPGPADSPPSEHPLPGRIARVVVDCFSPRALAAFWSQLLEMPVRELDTPERMVIAREDGRLPAMAFQHAQFSAPRWPDPAFPQQVHLDLWMKDEDPEPWREKALRLGAIQLPAIGGSQPVFADPAGHPFCL